MSENEMYSEQLLRMAFTNGATRFHHRTEAEMTHSLFEAEFARWLADPITQVVHVQTQSAAHQHSTTPSEQIRCAAAQMRQVYNAFTEQGFCEDHAMTLLLNTLHGRG